MSIEEKIRELCKSSDLTLFEPPFRNSGADRYVYAGGEARTFLNWDGSLDPKFESVSGQSLSLLDRFSNGSYVTVGMDPHDKDSYCHIARVDPIDQGIFSYRVRDPEPTVRIFGGFVMLDVLILLTWHERENCDFPFEAKRCRQAWDQILPEHPPITSDEIEYHVSKHYNIG